MIQESFAPTTTICYTGVRWAGRDPDSWGGAVTRITRKKLPLSDSRHRTHARKIPHNPCSVFKKVTLDLSVTFVIPQMMLAATVFIPNMGVPTLITSRAVNVMGREFANCLLDECYIRTTDRSGFLRHWYDITFASIVMSVYHAC